MLSQQLTVADEIYLAQTFVNVLELGSFVKTKLHSNKVSHSVISYFCFVCLFFRLSSYSQMGNQMTETTMP